MLTFIRQQAANCFYTPLSIKEEGYRFALACPSVIYLWDKTTKVVIHVLWTQIQLFYNDAIKDKFVDTEPVVEPEKAEEEEEKKDEEPEKEEKEEEEGEEGADNKEDTEVQDLKDHRTSL